MIRNAGKVFSLILSAIMLLTMFPIVVSGAEVVTSGYCGVYGDNLKWALDNSGTLTISGQGEMRDYATADGNAPWNVYCFGHRDEFPVIKVLIESGVNSIGNDAFRSLGVASILIPDTVTRIGAHAFLGNKDLVDIDIPDSVNRIGTGAFIGTGWFRKLLDKQPEGLHYAGKVAYFYNGTLPENSVVSFREDTKGIGGALFSGQSGLISVQIPDSVEAIGEFAFQSCTGLSDVSLPDAVGFIGNSAFYGCTALKTIRLPEKLTEVGAMAFHDTAWYDNQPDGIIYTGKIAYDYKGEMPENACIDLAPDTVGITESAFYDYSNLKKITIPEGVKSMGYAAFAACSALESVTLPAGLARIEDSVFSGCSSLVNVTIPDGVKSIGMASFSRCSSLKVITLPESLSIIEEYAFQGCSSLENIKIPVHVTYIEKYAFSGCTSLTYISIPEGMKEIQTAAFVSCSAVKDVYFSGSAERWNTVLIQDRNDTLNNAVIHYVDHPKDQAKPGDINGDGKITASDARLALRCAVGLETYAEGSAAFLACDVNGDGKVTAADARRILRAAVGLETLA